MESMRRTTRGTIRRLSDGLTCRVNPLAFATLSIALVLSAQVGWSAEPTKPVAGAKPVPAAKPLPAGKTLPTAKTSAVIGKPSAASALVVGTRVALPMPPGFTPATRFTGYQHQNGASIMVSEIPGPFDKVTEGFDAERMKTRGMTLVSKQEIDLGDYAGLVVQATQEVLGQKFRKWIVAFGDTETVILTANWPDALTGSLEASLKECLLSAKWDRSQEVDPTAGLSFSITPAPPLKLTKRLQNMLLFTPTGEIQVRAQGNPMFVVGPSIMELDMGDQKTFANKRLKQITELQNFDIKAEEKVNIGGMPGWEILASATDTRNQMPRMVYQTILFGNKVYYIMQGMVDWPASEGYEQTFKETARKFKLK